MPDAQKEAAKVVVRSIEQFTKKTPGINDNIYFKTNAWRIAIYNGSNDDVSVTLHTLLKGGSIVLGHYPVVFRWIKPGATATEELSPYYTEEGGKIFTDYLEITYRDNLYKFPYRNEVGLIEAKVGIKICFIASAAFNNEEHITVLTLRSFRENVLLRHRYGRYASNIYDVIGPKLAVILQRNAYLKPIVRRILGMIAYLVGRIKAPH